MKPIFYYLRTIYYSHRYLLFSIPLIAVVLWLISLYFFSNGAYDIIFNYQTFSTKVGEESLLVELPNLPFFSYSQVLILILPFLYLMFIQSNFYKSYDFTLPINSGKKLIAYIILGLMIFLYNYLFILIFNYAVEIYFQNKFYDVVMRAFDNKGVLYTSIPRHSIFYNGKMTLEMFDQIKVFLTIYPFFLFGCLLFQKYSLLKSLAILVSLAILGKYISTCFWPGQFYKIINPTFFLIYGWGPPLTASIICYMAFYNFLKEKEV